ncbi:hypothetical protein HDU78_007368 [Chytriomyces hyalinus]|nr:hypothetical protein HDU78_007368 [Chytriomyces hyalinus]
MQPVPSMHSNQRQLDTGLVRTLAALNYSMGTVSVATIIFMVHAGIYAADERRKTWIRWAAYADFMAFFIVYLGDMVQDSYPGDCRFMLKFAASMTLLRALRDAFKLGYVVHLGMNIRQSKRTWPPVWMLGVTLVWYIVRMSVGFHFDSPTNCAAPESLKYVRLAWYGFRGLVELLIGTLAALRLIKSHIPHQTSPLTKSLTNILAICLVSGGIDIWMIVNGDPSDGSLVISIERIVGVLTLQILVLNSDRDDMVLNGKRRSSDSGYSEFDMDDR